MVIVVCVTVRRCRLVTDWWQPSGDRFLPALSTCERGAAYGTHWSALQPETLCNTVFKIFVLRASKKKAGTQTLNVCKAHDSKVCAKEIWHVWTPHPEKAGFFPFLPHSLSFFSSWFPTTSWGLSHCRLYFYQQWNTETPFTAAELVSSSEFAFLKVSCLLLESSHTCTQPQACTQGTLRLRSQ